MLLTLNKLLYFSDFIKNSKVYLSIITKNCPDFTFLFCAFFLFVVVVVVVVVAVVFFLIVIQGRGSECGGGLRLLKTCFAFLPLKSLKFCRKLNRGTQPLISVVICSEGLNSLRNSILVVKRGKYVVKNVK